MKFSCTRENLSTGLMVVSGVAAKSVTLPILHNVLLRSENGALKLVTTNLELAISCVVRAKVDEEGEFTAPARLLTEVIAALPETRVDVARKENELEITADEEETTVKGTPATEFPLIPSFEEKQTFSLPTEDLKKALNQVIFAVSRTEVRQELSGVLFHFNPEGRAGKLVCAATDSYRLAEREVPLPQGAPQAAVRVIVPGRTLQELSRILGSYRDEGADLKNVRVVVNENQIVFRFGAVDLVSRLIESAYPDYLAIVPKEFKTEAGFSTSAFATQVKAASLFAPAGISGVTLSLDPKKGAIGVQSSSTQLGGHKGAVKAELTGEPVSAVLNYRYLLDGLQNLGSEQGVLKVVSGDAPCLLQPKGEGGYLYLVMPIRQ